MRKLNVGVIGTGMALEKLHYPAYQQLKDEYKLAAVCDTDKKKATEWANRLQLTEKDAYTDYETMLDRTDLDVIDIMVPIDDNYTVTRDVASRLSGRPMGIICEKPLAPNLQQALKAKDLATEFGIPIMIAENYRYNQEIDTIRDLVRTKEVGEIHYFLQNRVVNFQDDAKHKDKFPVKEWRQHPDFHGGAFMDTGVHDMAALRHIFGPMDKLQAFGRSFEDEYAPYSVYQVNFRFQSGVIGHMSFFCAGKEMQRPMVGLRIFGTKGMIFLEERDCGTINVSYNDGTQRQIPYEVQKGYYNELLNFHKFMNGIEPISVTPEIEFGDTKTIEDVLRSIRDGEIVSVDVPAYQQGAGEQQSSEYLQ